MRTTIANINTLANVYNSYIRDTIAIRSDLCEKLYEISVHRIHDKPNNEVFYSMRNFSNGQCIMITDTATEMADEVALMVKISHKLFEKVKAEAVAAQAL